MAETSPSSGPQGAPLTGARGAERHVVLLGAPGSGKGTQAGLLARRLGVPAISTGEMLRRAVTAGSELGREVEAVMAAGRLVDDALMAQVVEQRLAQPDAQDGFLLDGYPRTRPQAETLDRILGRRGARVTDAVLIAVPEGELVRRALLRQRQDDQESVVRERLRQYHEKTEPLVGFYRERGLLREIDGNRPVELVAADVVATLELESP